MRENRSYGSEGGPNSIGSPYPFRLAVCVTREQNILARHAAIASVRKPGSWQGDFMTLRLPFVRLSILAAMLVVLPAIQAAHAETWKIALAGNAYRTQPAPGDDGFRRDGRIAWSDSKNVYAVYVRFDRPARITLALRARVPEGRSGLSVTMDDQQFEVALDGPEFHDHRIGQFDVKLPGYVHFDLQGLRRSGPVYADIEQLVVSSDTEQLSLDYVKTNEGNMYYWGRRGPSVHLRYEVPRDRKLQYAYSELTIPPGQDPIGSFFMANGFGEGYFGIQVNSANERRVLFSVWSPFSTDNPREIPEDQRIVALAQGPEVRIKEFGNEGSGGQSYLVYPWKAGTTYRFLTEVTPDGKGNTVYRSWFGDKQAGEWRLVAAFQRPRTDTNLRGFHSFLESFHPAYGYLGRLVRIGNVWVRDTSGEWQPCATASFSVDPTGGGRHRRDFAGGSEGAFYFLRNCGFFNETVEAGEKFSRNSNDETPPQIDWEALRK